MWVIVAMTIGLGSDPRLAIVPGAEFSSKADCVRATHVRGNIDSDHAENSKIAFSFCVPKGSVQIGASASAAPDKGTDTK
jgi:hypothetical protein